MADQAWEKVKVTSTVQHGLESELNQLRGRVGQLQMEQQTLLATAGVLMGALYPLYMRQAALAGERNFLVACLRKFLTFKDQVRMLVEALSMKKEGGKSPRDRPKGSPLLTFRVAVVTVMAANRLANGTLRHCKFFTAQDAPPGVPTSLVCTGGATTQDLPFTGKYPSSIKILLRIVFDNYKKKFFL